MSGYDVVIIGGGPAGYSAAVRASQYKLKTALIEKSEIGGTCLNKGCIPAKYLISNTSAYKDAKNNSFIKNSDALSFDYGAMISAKNDIIGKLSKNVEKLLNSCGVDIIRGAGKIKDNNKVEVLSDSGTDTLDPKNILIAAGSVPLELPFLKINEKNVLSSTGILELSELPESLGIIGGGVIGCEFAYIYAILGVKVTIIEMLDQLLPYEDKIIAKTLENALKKSGVVIKTKTKLTDSQQENGKVLLSTDGNAQYEFDKVLLSVGRKASLDGLSDNIKRGSYIEVNGNYETSLKGVYAVGDVNGRSMYAHSAIAQGLDVIDMIAGKKITAGDKPIPKCVYTNPEVASVGLTEDEAKQKGIEYRAVRCPYAVLGKSHASGKTEGFYKLIVNSKDNKILGVQIIGQGATDLIGEAVVLINKGVSVDELSEMVHPHPTLSEGYWEIANLFLGKSVHIRS